MVDRIEGWAYPTRKVTKAHYIRNKRSLCGRYGYWGRFDEADQSKAINDGDCKGCAEKLVREMKT